MGLRRLFKRSDSAEPESYFNGVEPDPSARPLLFKSQSQEITSVFLMSLCTVMSSANQGAISLALPEMATYFRINGSALSWTISSYSLITGSFILLMARLADVFGRKRTVIMSFAWYAAWNLFSAFIHNDIGFDCMRGLQGIAGAAASPAAAGLLGAVYLDGPRKNMALATFAAGAPVGYVIGLVVGGICSQFLSFHAIMYFLAIIYGAAAVLVWITTEAVMRASTGNKWEQLRKLDYLGALLSTLGLLLLVFSLTEAAAAPKGWGTPYIIAMIIVGIVLLGLFVTWEFYYSNPLMPMFIWKYPGFALVMVVIACGWIDFQGVLNYYSSLFFQDIKGYSPILTTACLCPQAVMGIIVNIFAGYTLHIISGRILLLVGMFSFLGSALLWALVPLHLTYWAMCFPALILCVIGADLAYNVGNLFVLSTVPPELKSTAAGIFITLSQLAQSLGLAAATSIVASIIGVNQDGLAPARLLEGFRGAYWFAVGVSGVGVILAFFVRVGTQGGEHRQIPDNEQELPEKTGDDTSDIVNIDTTTVTEKDS
ncbi:major facilitator superfamily domain-containing protein [Dipodascopsis tothii]|uniref:major facilitator superfamily domain-containing protein n=1 Tax=Dipodascopsis tothii TaxID=44089 RepID=UPI0034CD58D6